MQKGLVSVVIPNYNYAVFLPEAIDSVLGQSYREIEVIVVDDGSTDGSQEILHGYSGHIRVIRQENQGVASARNNGVAASRGEFIAFLDADDAWLPAKAERQVEAFLENPEVGLVHVGVENIDETGKAIGTRTEGRSGWVADDLLVFSSPVILGGGSGFMVRREIFEELHGFDTRMTTSADWDLCYRVSVSRPVAFLPDVLLRYRIHGSNMHGNICAMERDMMLAYEKAFMSGAMSDRSRCYGNLHKVLAGSYHTAGQYGRFIEHTAKSIWQRPGNFSYFAQKLQRLVKGRNDQRGPGI